MRAFRKKCFQKKFQNSRKMSIFQQCWFFFEKCLTLQDCSEHKEWHLQKLELDVSLLKNAPNLKPHKETHTAFSTISLNFIWRCTFPEKLSIIQRKKHAACHLCLSFVRNHGRKMFEHNLQLHLKKDLILHKTDIISRNLIPKNNREKESSYDEWTYSTKNLKGINKVWTIRSGLCLRYFFYTRR